MSLAKNSLTIFYSKVIIIFLAFVVQIILSRKVGPEALGVYNLFLAAVGTFIFVGNFGVGNASIYLINKQKKNPIQLLSNVLIFGILWGVILAGLFYLIFLAFPYLFSGLSTNYVFLAFLVIPLTLLHNYLLPFFLAKFQILKWSVLSILCDFLVLLGIIIMVIILGLGIGGAIWAVVISYIVTLFFILLYIFKLFPPSFVFNIRLFYEEIKFGVSSYLGDIFSGAKISFMISVFIINVSLGIAAVGYYSVAYNIAAILLFIPFSFQQILYSKWSVSDEKEVDKRTPEIGRQLLILGFLVALFLVLVGKQFIILFFGKGFYPAFLPMLWVLPGFIFMSFASIFFNNFFAKGKPHITTIILAITLIINVVLALVLISIFGIGMSGASISISISYFIAAILSVFIFSKNSGYSIWEIIMVKPVDFENFYFNFRNIFRSKKILRVTPDLNIEKLKEYYQREALCLENIIRSTFDSDVLYTRLFYSSRVNKTLDMLDPKKREKILEIGCGPGYYTKKISQITSNLIATDISQNYVDIARAGNPHKILNYVTCSVENMPFEDNYFDKILMSEVIEHLISAEDGIKEIYRVLKPGGRVVITTPNKYSYLNIIYHIKVTLIESPFEQEHIKEFTTREISKLISKYFILEKMHYINFFPVPLPKFLSKKIGISKIDKFIQKTENFFNKIPLIRRVGFIIIISATKK